MTEVYTKVHIVLPLYKRGYAKHNPEGIEH